MEKKISITAIAMFAVILGMGTFVPVFAENNGSNGQKTTLCHFQEEVLADDGFTVLEEESVSIIEVNNRSLDTHLAHNDWIIDDSDGIDTNDSEDCPVTLDVDEI